MHPWKGVFRPETRDKKIIQSQHEIRQNGRIKYSMNGKWQGEQRCYSLESCSFTLAMAKIQRLTQILLTCSLSLWICGLRSSYKRFAKETGKYIRGEHFTVSLYCKMFSYISITYIVLLYQYHIYQDQYHLYSSPISVSPIYQYQYHYHLYQYQYHLYQYQYLKICVKLIFHYLRLHAITHTNLENVIANLVGNLPRRF